MKYVFIIILMLLFGFAGYVVYYNHKQPKETIVKAVKPVKTVIAHNVPQKQKQAVKAPVIIKTKPITKKETKTINNNNNLIEIAKLKGKYKRMKKDCKALIVKLRIYKKQIANIKEEKNAQEIIINNQIKAYEQNIKKLQLKAKRIAHDYNQIGKTFNTSDKWTLKLGNRKKKTSKKSIIIKKARLKSASKRLYKEINVYFKKIDALKSNLEASRNRHKQSINSRVSKINVEYKKVLSELKENKKERKLIKKQVRALTK